jgi:hypothetical protein
MTGLLVNYSVYQILTFNVMLLFYYIYIYIYIQRHFAAVAIKLFTTLCDAAGPFLDDAGVAA